MSAPATDRATVKEWRAMMQAIVQDRYGDAPEEVLHLEEVPQPVPGDKDVLVRVHAASVDRGTWHIMAGRPLLIRVLGFGFRRPRAPNPGRSFAGVIEQVGAGVSGLALGDEVYGTADGSFAEYLVAPAGRVARQPTNLSFGSAAAVPISAVAALQAVRDVARVADGEQVLVIGAAGGVGSFAVQIAAAFGAEVTAVSGPGSESFVRALGARHFVDYTSADFADGSRHYDVIIDTGGHRPLAQLRRGLTREGRLVIVGSENRGRVLGGFDRQIRARLMSPFVSQTLGMLSSKENAADLDVLRSLIEAGKVDAAVDHRYPLRQVPDAIRQLVDGRVRGKVVVDVVAPQDHT
jgi:NADPH:quinone reductase-like Zn-dependent oxidoreductase